MPRQPTSIAVDDAGLYHQIQVSDNGELKNNSEKDSSCLLYLISYLFLHINIRHISQQFPYLNLVLLFQTSPKNQMAVSPLNPNSRSISLPPRPHPIYPEFDEHLYRLRSSSFTSTPSTSSLIADRLAALIDLYDCVDGLLMLPQNQAISFANSVESLLDGSLKLLDVCSTSRDALLQIKDHVQGIQSVLRRRSIDELGEYVGAVKGVKKVVKKCLGDVRSLPKGCKAHVHMTDVLREVEGVTSEVFQSLLCYMGGVDVKARRRGSWGLVSKILVTMACEAEEAAPRNEFDDVDVVVGLFFGQRKRSGVSVSRLRSKMVKLENVIQDFDELLECLFRRLVKTRATILNILSQYSVDSNPHCILY